MPLNDFDCVERLLQLVDSIITEDKEYIEMGLVDALIIIDHLKKKYLISEISLNDMIGYRNAIDKDSI
jgi:hypothetical protein